jgi:GDP/UDP-N,N'-diacetylbacillosamine 2-epimerase (hydrolysing)
MTPKRICVVTGSRADYGLLRWVLQGIKEDEDLELKLVVTGAHLSTEFGLTYRVVEQDGFEIDRKIEMLVSSDSAVAVAKSMGLGLIGFADALCDLQPDLVLVLGDRFEILAAVSAALVLKIPVAHLHGGEITEGAFDDAMRHSITKMSHLHFVATDQYRNRVIQLGEHSDRVFVVGGLGIDSIKRLKLLDKVALEEAINFKLGAKSLLITFHPTTLDAESASLQMDELLAALHELEDTQLVFTLSNADTGGRDLNNRVHKFVEQHSNARAYASLGQERYLSCVALVDGVVGNSSSGILEVPSLNKGTVNIGDRQRGRVQAKSVINCQAKADSISAALQCLYSDDFQKTLSQVVNPYGEGGASKKIIEIIKTHELAGLTKKIFSDIPALNNYGHN